MYIIPEAIDPLEASLLDEHLTEAVAAILALKETGDDN